MKYNRRTNIETERRLPH